MLMLASSSDTSRFFSRHFQALWGQHYPSPTLKSSPIIVVLDDSKPYFFFFDIRQSIAHIFL
jgi:hypothetical protein